MEEKKADREANPVTNQQNNQFNFGQGNYGKLMEKLLGNGE